MLEVSPSLNGLCSSHSFIHWPIPSHLLLQDLNHHPFSGFLFVMPEMCQKKGIILLMVQKSGVYQLRLVVFPIMYKVLYIRWLFGISSINSRVILQKGTLPITNMEFSGLCLQLGSIFTTWGNHFWGRRIQWHNIGQFLGFRRKPGRLMKALNIEKRRDMFQQPKNVCCINFHQKNWNHLFFSSNSPCLWTF